MLLPALVIALFAVSPVLYLILRFSEAGSDAFDLIFNSRTLATLVRTVQLGAAVFLLSAALSLILGWLTVRTQLPWRRFWSVVTVLPLVIPSYVGALTVIQALGPRGLLQQSLEGIGVDRLPEIYGFSGAVFTLTLLTYPYLLLSIRTALWGMDPSMEESSRLLGRGPVSTFLTVTLPQLKPALAGGGLLVVLYTMSDFGAVSLLRYDSFTSVIYAQYQLAFDRTLAAATSLVLVVLAFSLVAAEAASRGRSRYYKSTADASRRSGLAKLGRWRWPAIALCSTVALLSLVVPLAVLVYLFQQGVSAGESFQSVWRAAGNSLYASGLAAVATVAAAAPIALLSVRYGGRAAWFIERASYAGFALPGIVVALALVFFGIRYAQPLYQSMTMLVVAYVVLFLPVALGGLRTALLQVHPHLEDAARTLGKTSLQAFLSVSVPLLRPGIITSVALVFLVTMKELPATLILGPTGFSTLATVTWTDATAALLSRSAFAALILVAASAVPMAAMIYWERRDEW
ncbi:MAG TPA: iron ABC transporter permease [Dehalococcoidia bacterium]|nr:iron ABC transporter permease [Dehalococcoidia bacterium]